jgi:beta-mannosidase
MGSIFWQLNDCWPVASWSSIDYYGRWKALQYYARRFYAPVLVSPHVEDGALKVYIVNDRSEPLGVSTFLRVQLMSLDGRVLLDERKPVEIAPLASKVYLEWPMKKLAEAGAADTSKVFVVAFLSGADALISSNLTYLAPTKEVHLIPANLKVDVRPYNPNADHEPQYIHLIGEEGPDINANYSIFVTSPVLARSVYLSFGNLNVKVSDNYFDILPGKSVEVSVKSSASLDALKAQLKVVSLTDAFAQGGGASPSVSATR